MFKSTLVPPDNRAAESTLRSKHVSHYDDVIMGVMASQITSLTIVYSTVYSDAVQRKHQSSASLAFVRGIPRSPVNSPHKWPINAENVSISWRHHVLLLSFVFFYRFVFLWHWRIDTGYLNRLIHGILQMTFSNAFCWKEKLYIFVQTALKYKSSIGLANGLHRIGDKTSLEPVITQLSSA